MVRRSDRVRGNSNGFKLGICRIKNCLGCSNDPPIMSPRTLKKIGTSMCQLQEEQLEEQALLSKKKLEPMGKKVRKSKEDKGKKPGSQQGHNSEASNEDKDD